MAYKRVLVPLLGYDCDLAALNAAKTLADLSDAEILALHVRADALAETPLMVDVGVALSELMEAAERHIAKRAAQALKSFESFRASHTKVIATFREEKGQSAELLPKWGKVSDLIVIGRPKAEDAIAASIIEIEHAIFGSGHPVLIVPADYQPDQSLTASVLVSWNGSVEVTHAIGAALPVLAHVKRLGIVAVGDAGAGQEVNNIKSYLSSHGIPAEIIKGEEGGQATAAKILATAHREKAGMILMGAYTRSRLRQLILGGVTSYMIEKSDLPVFMMH